MIPSGLRIGGDHVRHVHHGGGHAIAANDRPAPLDLDDGIGLCSAFDRDRRALGNGADGRLGGVPEDHLGRAGAGPGGLGGAGGIKICSLLAVTPSSHLRFPLTGAAVP